jgi:hypothetical protein
MIPLPNRGASLEKRLQTQNVKWSQMENGPLRCSVDFADQPKKLEAELFEILLSGPVTIWCEEEPDAVLREELELLSPGVWHGTVTSSGLARAWLYLGGWFLCDAATEEIIDYVKSAPVVASEATYANDLHQRGATVFISSFFDDREWEIWVRRES